MKGTVSRIAIAGAVVAVLMTVIVVPAGAAPVPLKAPRLDVANPLSGDHLRRGQNWIAGVACDPDAPINDDTAGIARVDLFLGDRDAGGSASFRPGGFFGRASAASLRLDFSSNVASTSRLGIPSPDLSTCRQSFAAWRILPASFRPGVWDLFVYAVGKNGMETKMVITGLRVDR